MCWGIGLTTVTTVVNERASARVRWRGRQIWSTNVSR